MKNIYNLKPNSYHKNAASLSDYFYNVQTTTLSYAELRAQADETMAKLNLSCGQDFDYDILRELPFSDKPAYCYYHAVNHNVPALLALISMSGYGCETDQLSDLALFYLMCIINCIELQQETSERYNLIVADCHIGVYGDHAAFSYDTALQIYTKLAETLTSKYRALAKRRKKVCKLLMSGPSNGVDKKILKEIDKDSNIDPLSKTVLAFYYITTPGIRKEDKNKDRGKRLLFGAVQLNYAPAVKLLIYLASINVYKRSLCEELSDAVIVDYAYTKLPTAEEILGNTDIQHDTDPLDAFNAWIQQR